VAIKRGIFQGDSLSPLLFCLALTSMLNKQGGYEAREKIKSDIYPTWMFEAVFQVTAGFDHCQNT